MVTAGLPVQKSYTVLLATIHEERTMKSSAKNQMLAAAFSLILVLISVLAIGCDEAGLAGLLDGDLDGLDIDDYGAPCENDADCKGPLICFEGQCITEYEIPCDSDDACIKDVNCEEGYICNDLCICEEIGEKDGDWDDEGSIDGDGSEPPVNSCDAGPQVMAEPKLDFGYVAFDTDALQTLHIINTCPGKLTIHSIEIVSLSDEFHILNAPEGDVTIVGLDGVLEVDVLYHPTDVGVDEGEIVISSDDPDGTFRVQLISHYKGSVDIDVEPNPLDFHSVVVGDPPAERSLIVKNMRGGEEDNAVLRINSVYVESESAATFTIVDDPGTFYLGQDQEVELHVRCQPADSGDFVDRLIFESNDPDEPEYAVDLLCKGVRPTLDVQVLDVDNKLDFGIQRVDSPVSVTLSLSNSGGGDLIVQVPEIISGSSSAFTMDVQAFNNAPVTLRGGESVSLPVTFKGSIPGEHTGQIRIDSNTYGQQSFIVNLLGTASAALITADPAQLDFGAVRVQDSFDKTLTLTNEGQVPVTLMTIALADPSDAISFAPDDVLENIFLDLGESHTLHLSFAPLARANYDNKVHYTTDDMGTPEGDVLITAQGIAPVIEVKERDNPAFTDEVDFGEVSINAHAERTLDISNIGDAVMTINSVQLIQNSGDQEFSLTELSNIQLIAGHSVVVLVSYDPVNFAGQDNGRLSINSDDPFNGLISVGLKGLATNQRLFTSPPSPLTFRDTHYAATSTETVRLYNVGELGSLIIGSVEMIRGEETFTLQPLHPDQELPFELFPNQQNFLALEVTFKPIDPGSRESEPSDFEGAFLITSNSYLETETEFLLQGKGIPCPDGWWDLDDDPEDCEYRCDLTEDGIEICDGEDNDCNGTPDDGDNVTQNCTPPEFATAVCTFGFCDFLCIADYHRCGELCYADDDPEHCGAGCIDCQDDELACTFNVCVDDLCGHQIEEQFCTIGNICYAFNDEHPLNECQACIPYFDQEDWSDSEDGSPCNDELFCTVEDLCLEGECTDTQPRDCSEALTEPQCQKPVCDEDHSLCQAEPDNIDEECDDGDPCTTGDICSAEGACVGQPLEWIGQDCDGEDVDLCLEGVYECQEGAQVCTDESDDNLDLCNETDDDCNPETADGAHELWLGGDCDGEDSDLCSEGVYECAGGQQSCTDVSDDTPDLCDGADDDCNPLTADGSDEAWLLDPCDGEDIDLCDEGMFVCAEGSKTCSDNTNSNFDLCNGEDDDCNPDTADGFHESWFGGTCDGEDLDLCHEGDWLCVEGNQTCTDLSNDNLDECNGMDDDCNPFTLDGEHEDWYNQQCDGEDSDLCKESVWDCEHATQHCLDDSDDTLDYCDTLDNDCDPSTSDGAHEAWFNLECDGPDQDLCIEGIFECMEGEKACSDTTGDNREICNDADDDCNPNTPDGSEDPLSNTPCDGADDPDLCEDGTRQCIEGSMQCVDGPDTGVELCDGFDNDCNPETLDGVDEPWLEQPCDGNDLDLCDEGIWLCDDGNKTCTDISADNPELCNGDDDDCNPGTADGVDESWIGDTCDGQDLDFCEEGVKECQEGAEYCTDLTGNAFEQCDGLDNDCDPATPDGAHELWLNNDCDGLDQDLCDEGVFICEEANKVCTDTSGNNFESCDGQDNDCNPDTGDGVDEAWFNTDCDGQDQDLCDEGVFVCTDSTKTCNDETADNPEICNGQDDDCNAATPDGVMEDWMETECDGPDTDFCTEGIFQCVSGIKNCNDITNNNLELCNGQDDDCNPDTADGIHENWLQTSCDGEDSDLCLEGVYICSGGGKTCTDESSHNLELCNGQDDDCNTQTPDGADEAWLLQECDGNDNDLCPEGVFLCINAGQSCSDTSGDSKDLCDNEDNDCDQSTPDGVHESWYLTDCDGSDSDLCKEGVNLCSDGEQSCNDSTGNSPDLCNGQDDDCNPFTGDGIDEEWFGDSCDGTDSDFCREGNFSCLNGSQSCSDNSSNSLELCNGQDDDCNPATDDGADENWLGDDCDGEDLDLCLEGGFICKNGNQSCDDNSGNNPDLCNGQDDDCNPLTIDGADESWLADPCDGQDSDLCEEGVYACANGSQSCTDITGDSRDYCNGDDDDCDPSTPDGSAESWFQGACDGNDADLCTEGQWICSGGDKSCNDSSGDNPELCNGQDDDCNAYTTDGIDESWLNDPCDGQDSDLCNEGIYQCAGGSQTCSDLTGNILDVCDGTDNDCNPNTADGADASWLGDDCDGQDSDLCNEGVYQCTGGSQSCSDSSGNNLEICDGQDNDCNSGTPDGSDEALYNAPCDSAADPDLCEDGTYLCNGSSMQCFDDPQTGLEICDNFDNDCDPSTADGSDETWLGQPCDGPDEDLCTEGVWECAAGGSKHCTDQTGDTPDTCGNGDDDCNPSTPDGSDENWYATICDGADSDLCEEGQWFCPGGVKTCDDDSGNDLEICDTVDNDCNPATADGADAEWLGDTCDGLDTDHCEEGSYYCGNGQQLCSDNTGNTYDTCDGQDNDCNPTTPDGADEPWMQTPTLCDGNDNDLCEEGYFECSGGSQSCTDNTGNISETCDGLDNDCNPATADGADENWFGDSCDGYDADLCDEGIYQCSGGTQICNDYTGNNLELCDGNDNDCNANTSDGSDENWLGDNCDGGDTDLCKEGVYVCSGGSQSCNDNTGNIYDTCDGADNDCNPATADGANEVWLGDSCDGPDSDLCKEGDFQCVTGSKTCTDNSSNTYDYCNGQNEDCNAGTPDGYNESWYEDDCDGNDADYCLEGLWLCSGGNKSCSDPNDVDSEICNGADDDCNPGTPDGSHEGWLGSACDGNDTDLCNEGVYQCTGGNQTCSDTSGNNLENCNGQNDDCNGSTPDGYDEWWYHVACDGSDTDQCLEGIYLCQGSSTPYCNDTTGSTYESCNGTDDDCDGATDENTSGNPLSEDCYTGPAGTEDVGICHGGTKTCSGGTWGACNGQQTPQGSDAPDINGIDSNCDGVDGEISKSIFVSKSGSNTSSCGTSTSNTCLTIQYGIDRANAYNPKRYVLVAGGTYTQSIKLRSGVSIYGGYDTSTWVRNLSIVSKIQGSDIAAVRAGAGLGYSITATTRIQGFTIAGYDVTGQGESYALWVNGVTNQYLRIESCRIEGGNGGYGTAGSNGSAGSTGNNGSNATNYNGGAGGTVSCGANGGTGGSAWSCGNTAGVAGSANGDPTGGGGGGSKGSNDCSGCNDEAGNGGNGYAGSYGGNGSGGTRSTDSDGRWSGYYWLEHSSLSSMYGVRGYNGKGGGGGGAGGTDVDDWCWPFNGTDLGGGGGGGGAGGCGGARGTPGGQGGGSIAVALIGSTTNVYFSATQILRGSGGNGGKGGNGGNGGNGMGKGNGKDYNNEGGKGGNGAVGGDGGGAGGAAGGCGGPSLGILKVSSATFSGSVTYLGGGSGGSGGGAGTGGRRGGDGAYGGSGDSGCTGRTDNNHSM